jgi:PPOX class probable F420-dependent enzyme
MTETPAIPAKYQDLIDRPLIAHLATVRPNGAPQANPMWFVWDGEFFWFTHTNFRQKFKNVDHEPRVAFSITDPDNGYRYIEVRGEVVKVEEDPTGSLYAQLSARYGQDGKPPADAPDRVRIAVRPTFFSNR